MTIISGVVVDSSRDPARGSILWQQAQRFDDGQVQVTRIIATARVVDGELQDSDGGVFSMPPSPADTLVLVTEVFNGERYSFYTRIPDVAEIEYRLLEVVEAGPEGTVPPAWVADVLAARDAAEASAASAAVAADRADAAADSVDAPAINARFVAVEDRATALEGDVLAAQGEIEALESVDASQGAAIINYGLRIAAVEDENATQSTTLAAYGTDIAALESADSALDTRLTADEVVIGEHTTDIGGLEARALTIESNISTLQDDVSGLEISQLTQDGRLTTLESSDTAIGSLSTRVTGTETQNTVQDWQISTLSGAVTALTTTVSGKADAVHTHTISDVTGLQPALDGKADLVGGLIPASQLPAYVDDVLEFPTFVDFPAVGESGKLYLAGDRVNKIYRWAGSGYADITGDSLVLGETSSTAYRGDRGKEAYDHTLRADNPHGTTKAQVGLGNVDNTSDLNKPISTAAQAALDAKQNALVSGTNIKTVGGVSLLGSGNVTEVQNSLTASTTLAPSVTAVNTGLSGKANTVHTHAIADVTGLDPRLAAIEGVNTTQTADILARPTLAQVQALGYVSPLAGSRFRVIECMIQQVGGVWSIVNDATTEPYGVASVAVVSSDRVRVTFTNPANQVIAASAGSNRILNDARISLSVDATPTYADIFVKRDSIGGMCTYNGTSFTFTGDITAATYAGGNGLVTITHPTITGDSAVVVERNTDRRAQVDSTTATTTLVQWRASNGNVSAPPNNIGMYLQRVGLGSINPALSLPAGNRIYVRVLAEY